MRLAFMRSASQSDTSVLPVPQAITAVTRSCLFKTSENGFERFRLMRLGVFTFRRERRALEPIGNGLQVVLRQPVEIVPANAEEAAAGSP